MTFKVGNGREIEVEISDREMPKANTLRAGEIWETWMRLRLSDSVLRSGVIYCGAYPKQELAKESAVATILPRPVRYSRNADAARNWQRNEVGLDHAESVGDHTRSAGVLLWLISQAYPELFWREPAAKNSAVEQRLEVLEAFYRLFALIEYHDLAEVFTGDIPDDGARSEYGKDHDELEIVLRMVESISDTRIRTQIVKDFINFQYPLAENPYEGWTEYDGKLIQLARVIDKADACLAALKLEAEGHPADLNYRSVHYGYTSERDQEFIELCETSMIADCWTARFASSFHNYHGFQTLLDIITVATFDVRGKWFPWWQKLCDKYQILG